MKNEKLKDLVLRLSQPTGNSGAEDEIAVVATEEMERFGEVRRDVLGNLILTVNGAEEGKEHILLDAHMDEIGMMVQDILDNGFIRPANSGGMDVRVLASAEVWIHGKNKDFYGIVTSTPPHLKKDGDSNLAGKMDEIFIDTGLSKEEIEKEIQIGDRITLSGEGRPLLGNRFCSKALDDRASCTAILRALELLENEDLKGLGLSVSFTSREEVGGQGAATVAFALQPDIAIVVDATPCDQDYVGKAKCGAIGDGVAIGVCPVLDRTLSNELIDLAKDQSIPCWIEVMERRTGTNADEIQVSGGGVRCSTLSIPQRYAHTAIEVMDVDDIENTAKLIAAYIQKKAVN